MEVYGGKRIFNLNLIGEFQVMNVLTALGLAVACGSPLEKLIALIPLLKGVPGRLQQVAMHPNGARIYIDYAHTPAALAKVLSTIRPHVQGKLWVAFGCGGDRDAGKRPEMGASAVKLADNVVVTDDNPRSEDPVTIRAAIMASANGAMEVPGRREAIEYAITKLSPGDVLVIAGKGHEKTQTIGTQILPFDDAEVAKEIAEQL